MTSSAGNRAEYADPRDAEFADEARREGLLDAIRNARERGPVLSWEGEVFNAEAIPELDVARRRVLLSLQQLLASCRATADIVNRLRARGYRVPEPWVENERLTGQLLEALGLM
jgi:hypothetical protein